MPQDVKRYNDISISNLPTKLPDYATPVQSGSLPDYAEEVKTAPTEEPKSDILDSLSKHIFEAPEFIKSGAKSIADTINPGVSTPSGGFLETIGAIPDLARNMISEPMATIKGGLAGMTEGAANLLNPANIAQTIVPESRALSIANKSLGAFQGIHGIDKIRQGKFAEGIGDIGFGALGLLGGKKKSLDELPSYAKPVAYEDAERRVSISNKSGLNRRSLDDVYDEFKQSNLEREMEARDKLRGTPADTSHSSVAQEVEKKRQKAVIKDYWITDQNGKKILNPKYQFSNKFGGMRDNSNFTEGSGGLTDIAAGRFTRHEMPPKAVFKGWQEDGEGSHIALYDIKGGPLDKSTVSEKSLKAAGIDIPETPKFSRELSPERIAAENRQKALREGKSKPTVTNLFADETGAVRFGPNKQAPIKPSTRNLRQPSDEVVDKLINAVESAGPKRAIQDDMYSIERAKRIQATENVKTKGLPGFYEQLHELKSELPKVDFERTKLKQSEVNDLINYVTNSPLLLPYEKIRAKIGLLKMLSSKREEVPQRGELALLSEVFGKKFDDVIQMHGGLGGAVSMKVANEMANLSKSIMASIDMSAPLRQGLPLIHKKEWWGSIKPMVESFGSQDRFDALQDSIKSRPGYLLGKKSGLHLTDMAEHKEEAYSSKLANLIPGVKMSERAYVGFLNKLRADTFDSLINDAVQLGHDPNEIGKAIAKYVNTATGRGNLGRLDGIAKELNVAFFSPRLIASRLTMLNPKTYVSKDIPAFVRKESLKSLMAVAGFSLTMNSLAHMMGASVSLDPTNSDFMKSKFGNTRLDPNGGFQQYIVAATRLLTGQTTSSTSNQTREIGKKYGSPSHVSMILGVGDKYNRSFLENKFSPLVGLTDDILAKRNPETQGLGGIIHPTNNIKNPSIMKGDYSADIVNRFVPLMVNDMIDLYKDDPNLFMSGKAILGAGAALGMGMQTYKNQPKKNQLKIGVR
jgi:hypothetical protein